MKSHDKLISYCFPFTDYADCNFLPIFSEVESEDQSTANLYYQFQSLNKSIFKSIINK